MNLTPVLKYRAFDSNGDPLAGGKLYTYAAGTSTLQATYTDQAGGTPNANPVVLDANGEASVWLDPALSYKFVLKDSTDVTQWTVDNVIGILTPDAVNTASIQDDAVTLAKLSANLGANQVLGANTAATALEAKSITAGDNIQVTHSVGGIEISSPGVDSIVQHLEDYDSDIKAGEALTIRNAICLDLNLTNYKYFKCDTDLANRKNNFVGFAKAAATVTPHIQTYTISAAFVASNSISLEINGRGYSATVYSGDSDTTLAAVATKIATDQDIASAVVTEVGGGSTNDRVIVVTGRGGLTISIVSVVTLGASQPTVTMATTQAAAGDAVECQTYGPLSGFTGLTQSAVYYLSGTAGGITATPTDSNPVMVGQALSDTVLYVFINPTLRFGMTGVFIRSHGSSTAAAAGGTQDVEHYNFTSWAAGSSSSAGARFLSGSGEGGYGSYIMQLDGLDTGNTVAALFQQYNKSSWSTLTNRATARYRGGCAAFNGYFYSAAGLDGAAANSSEVNKWNGASWATPAATVAADNGRGAFSVGSLFNIFAGSATNLHDTLNSSDTHAAAAVYPATDYIAASANSTGGQGFGIYFNTTSAYQWSGSAWSAAIAATYTPAATAGHHAAAGYSSATGCSYVNGGCTSAPAAVGTTTRFNGTSFTSDSASVNSRDGSCGGVA